MALVAASTDLASAQDQATPPQSSQASSGTSMMSGATAAGYIPTTPQPWPHAGRIAYGGMRPIPPGYVETPSGELVFDPPPDPTMLRPYSRSPGVCSRWLAAHCQEKYSFCMYIRGYGPAIHSRPASVCW
jgi:hypothetical protein